METHIFLPDDMVWRVSSATNDGRYFLIHTSISQLACDEANYIVHSDKFQLFVIKKRHYIGLVEIT